MAQITKIERILNLVSYLLKERRPVSWREIAGKVVGYDDGGDPKSLERRFERDKSALKELGIPVRFYPPGAYDTEGYLISREHCFLDTLDLLPHEAALLNLVSELGVRKGEKSSELLSALQKLRFDEEPGSSGATPAEDLEPEKALLRLDKVASLRGSPNLDPITEAIHQNRPVRFKYYALSSGETSVRNIDPYGLGFVRGDWYMVGLDHKRKELRQFKVSRIKGRVELVGPARSFEPPAKFKVMDEVGVEVWARPNNETPPVEVVVLVDRAIAGLVDGPVTSTSVEEHEDGSATMIFDVYDEPRFIRWLLGHARHVRVLQPDSLRERFLHTIEEMAEHHAGAPGSVRRPVGGPA